MTVHEQLNHWKSVAPSYTFVYVIQGERDGPVKIGKALDVRQRMAGLQTGNPHRLRLLHVLPGGRPLERQLHQRLAPYRLEGEWFSYQPEVAEVLALIADVAERAVSMGLKPSELVPLFVETHVPDVPPKPPPPPTDWAEVYREHARNHPDSPFFENPHMKPEPAFQPHRSTT